MKKYIITAAAVLSAVSFTACDDMLDTDPRVTEATTATFPGYPADVEALNAGTYSIMNVLAGRDATSFPLFMWEIMSDDCYGSGGLQDDEVKSLHHLVQKSVDQYQTPFITLYGGVKRANNQIETIDNVNWKGNTTQRNQLLGEGYFMRGLYNLWLTQMYGDIPILTSSANITDEMEQEVSAETVGFPQILSDFVSAANLMSTEKKSGHANKFVAEGFIARAWMFWAGFYKNAGELKNANPEAMELVEQEGCPAGTTLTKQNVIDALRDVVSKGGYKLCDDYRSLWQYSNSLLWAETRDGGKPEAYYDGDGNKLWGNHSYEFIADMKEENCFDKPGMGNGNTEEMFGIQFMNASKWAIGDTYYTNSRQYSNYVSCFWGLRCNSTNGDHETTYPFNQGWGQGTPSVNIWEDWTAYEAENAVGEVTVVRKKDENPVTRQKGDIRKLGSMIDCVNELDAYKFEKDDCEESGYSVKKFNSVCLDACAKSLDTWWTKAPGYVKSSLENSMQGDHFEDFYIMRYPDVLLMLTELTGEAEWMNQVQERAGVKQTEYSWKAVQDERRFEFAFEGLRFNDMRRWTGKGTKGGYASQALQAQAGKLVTVRGSKKQQMQHMTCSWTERYEATDGFLSKPQAQITLYNGKLKQNPGWDANDDKTVYKVLY